MPDIIDWQCSKRWHVHFTNSLISATKRKFGKSQGHKNTWKLFYIFLCIRSETVFWSQKFKKSTMKNKVILSSSLKSLKRLKAKQWSWQEGQHIERRNRQQSKSECCLNKNADDKRKEIGKIPFLQVQNILGNVLVKDKFLFKPLRDLSGFRYVSTPNINLIPTHYTHNN